MSRTNTIGLALAILIASAFLVAARDTSTTIEVANYPAVANDVEPQAAARAPRAALDGISGSLEASFGVSALAENAYDFNNLDGIPGFGTLPPAYDSTPVMPKIGSK